MSVFDISGRKKSKNGDGQTETDDSKSQTFGKSSEKEEEQDFVVD
jgi:hypothetical protein